MPIHVSWKSMARSIANNPKYCKKGSKRVCKKLTSGAEICGCAGGWSIFYATMKKRGWDEGKPRSKKVTETIFNQAVEETVSGFTKWVCEKWGVSETVPKKNKKVQETEPKNIDEIVKWYLEEKGL